MGFYASGGLRPSVFYAENFKQTIALYQSFDQSFGCLMMIFSFLHKIMKSNSTEAMTSSISSLLMTPSPFKSYKWNVHLAEEICLFIVIKIGLISTSGPSI